MFKKQAFTLVELIVVISIIAILSTIGFMSYEWYTGNARDSVRLSDIKMIEKSLETSYIKTGQFPNPGNSVDITASWSIVLHQGYISDIMLSNIGISSAKDPATNIFYTYSTTASQNAFQILAWTESSTALFNNIVPNSYAANNEININKFPITAWYPLWITVFSGTLTPIQETGTGIDIVKTTASYSTILDNKTVISGTGGVLFSTNPYHSCKRLLESQKITSDGIYNINPDGWLGFSVYCDMTTDGGGWTMVRWLYKEQYPWEDNLVGTDVRGSNPLGYNFSSSWSIKFNAINFSQYLFQWRDKRAWVEYQKSDLILTSWWTTCGEQVSIKNSYNESKNIGICKRIWTLEDPWISVRENHGGGSYNNDIIYGENGWATPWQNIHQLANTDTSVEFSSVVFVR